MKQKQVVIVIALLTAVSMLGDSMLYIALPVHYRELGLLPGMEIGILLSVNRLIRLPVNPLVGWLYRHISGRTGMLLAVLLAALTTTGYGWSRNFAVWLVLRCLWGVAWTFLRLGAYFSILAVSNEQNRGDFMGTYNGLYRLGSLVGMFVGGLLVDRFGLPPIALWFGVLPLLSLPFIFRYVPRGNMTGRTEERASTSRKSAERVKFRYLQPNVFWTLLSGLLIAMIFQGAFTSTLSSWIQAYPETKTLYGTVLAGAAGLAGVIQGVRWAWEPWLAPWFGRMSDRASGRIPLFIGSLCTAAIGFLLVHLHLPIVLWLCALLLIQVTATSLTTLIDALASDVANTVPKVTFMTSYSIAVDCGAALGPMISYISKRPDFLSSVYWGACAVLVLLAGRWYWYGKKRRSNATHLSV